MLESLLNKVANIQGELTRIEWIVFQANPHLFQLTCPQIAVLETKKFIYLFICFVPNLIPI